jgi:DNA-binding NarL/FixJ family response regulator
MGAIPIRRVTISLGQRIFAKALCDILNDSGDLTVVAVTPTVPQDGFASLRPDVIIIDIDDAALDPADVIARCRERVAHAKICALSLHLRPEVMHACVRAGADGYVVKDASPEEFVRAIGLIVDGATYVDARVGGSAVRTATLPRRVSSEVNELSVRETDVLRLIAQGCSNREIGERLCLSEKTVKNHVSRILYKITAPTRTHAALHAIRAGIG